MAARLALPAATRDDIATVAYWYQTLPLARSSPFPDRDAREII